MPVGIMRVVAHFQVFCLIYHVIFSSSWPYALDHRCVCVVCRGILYLYDFRFGALYLTVLSVLWAPLHTVTRLLLGAGWKLGQLGFVTAS